MFELVIRGGTVVDGTGAPARMADVAIDGGVITEVGPDLGPGSGRSTPTACSSRPGLVDIHTHYDGQVDLGPAARALVAGTASPPSSWATAASASRPSGRASTTG